MKKQSNDWGLKDSLVFLAKKTDLLKGSRHGLERECLRINSDGTLANEPHPEVLGAPLTHPKISTDFSEAQLELITSPHTTASAAINELKNIHAFIYKLVPGQLLWPASMPCKLPDNPDDIPLAQYGDSHLADEKTTYRRGLGCRYGRAMQTVSGIHYNFSFSNEFWGAMYKKFATKDQMQQDFISAGYFRVIRNFRFVSWMDSYLFGATPAVDKSYLHRGKKGLKKLDADTYYGPYATSLRMSHFGYTSKAQESLRISCKDVETYAQNLREATEKTYGPYARIGVTKKGKRLQLNDSILQIPNEFYSVIRPKRSTHFDEDLLDVLEQKGVEYIEVRSVDISPDHPEGISLEHIRFLEILMHYCFLKSNLRISNDMCLKMRRNHDKVAMEGRKPNLKLFKNGKKVLLSEWGKSILSEMQDVAELMDKNYKDDRYQKNLKKQMEKIIDPDKTPSAQVIQELKRRRVSYAKFYQKMAQDYSTYFKNTILTENQLSEMQTISNKSVLERDKYEVHDAFYVPGYQDLEISTNIVIREALERGVKVKVLDRAANFIQLKKGSNKQYVQQATITGKDPLISYFINGNKAVTKQLLSQEGILVPLGETFTDPDEALESYKTFSTMKAVIKPYDSNYGIGISFLEKGDKEGFEKGVKEAFKHSNAVIIEQFLEGTEYRLLVLDGEVIAVVKRLPANIVGDGVRTIKELIDQKNKNPKNYKIPKEYISLGPVEKAVLKSKKLTTRSVLKKGQQLFLRKNSNVSTGGDAIDFTDEMPQIYKDIAVRAAKESMSKICGIDMIINDLQGQPVEGNYGIIELNYNPVLKFHNFPLEGKNRNVGKRVLDFLGY